MLELLDSMSNPGLLNNRYQIEGRIGSGGMEQGYCALGRISTVSNGPVAVEPPAREHFSRPSLS